MGFAIKIGEEGRQIGFATLCRIECIQCGIDGRSALGVDYLACSIEKNQQPGAGRLGANQGQVDAPLAAITTNAASEMLAGFNDLDGNAEAHA